MGCNNWRSGGVPSDGFDLFSFLYAFFFITNLDEIETQGILHMVAELLNPPATTKKCCNVHPTTHHPQPQHDNKLNA